MTKTIFELNDCRIIQVEDAYFDMDNLKGDCFNPDANPDICPEQLKIGEIEFEKDVYIKGVFGYILERWCPEVGQGWYHVDSCWGFIGDHDTEKHYIVDELKRQI